MTGLTNWGARLVLHGGVSPGPAGRCAADPGAIDASVAEGALRRGDSVVTGNAEHIQALATGVNRKLDVIRI
ncbi:MAG: hypothetical protein ACRDOI_33515 [Trebonia sp.]